MKRRIAIFLTLLLPLPLLGDFDLREELPAKTFKASGLDKLTPQELQALNTAVEALLNQQEDILRAALFQSQGPDRIESRIMGEFTGWRGGTIFELENGQVWQQSEAATFKVRKKSNPEVVIRRGMFGSYLLKVEGYRSDVKVERIK
jgi:hypothetical protein